MPVLFPRSINISSSSSSSSSSSKRKIHIEPPSVLLSRNENNPKELMSPMNPFFHKQFIERGITAMTIEGVRIYYASSAKLNYLNKAINDYDISSVSNAVITGVVNGSVIIEELHDLSINDKESKEKEKFVKPLINDHYTEFARSVLKNIFAYGFAAVIIKENRFLGTVPGVLDISYGYEFAWYHNEVGDVVMELFYSRRDESKFFDFTAQNKPIPRNDIIFIYDGNRVPGSDGTFRSCVEECMEPLLNNRTLSQLSTTANVLRLNPPLVVEDHTISTNRAHAIGSLSESIDKADHMELARLNKQSNERQDTQTSDINSRQEVLQSSLTNIVNDPLRKTSELLSSVSELLRNTTGGFTFVPDDKKLTRQLLPEEPSELIPRTNLMKRTICNIFGLPPQQLIESTSGRTVASATIIEEGWDNKRESLQRMILYDITDIYQSLYARRAIPSLQKRAISSNMTLHTTLVMELIKVNITIQKSPKTPTKEELKLMYEDGTLTYDTYIQKLSELTGLPLNSFEKSEEVSIKKKQLRTGIPPPEEGKKSSSSSSSTTTTKKRTTEKEKEDDNKKKPKLESKPKPKSNDK